MVVVMLRKLSLSQRLNFDIAMDVFTDIVCSISVNRVGHFDVEKWLLVQQFVFNNDSQVKVRDMYRHGDMSGLQGDHRQHCDGMRAHMSDSVASILRVLVVQQE